MYVHVHMKVHAGVYTCTYLSCKPNATTHSSLFLVLGVHIELKSIHFQLTPGSSTCNCMGINTHKQYAVIIHDSIYMYFTYGI